jgi:hypothetical protein
MRFRFLRHLGIPVLLLLGVSGAPSWAAGLRPKPVPGEFPPGAVRQLADLPAGRFRSRLEQLAVEARNRSLTALAGFHFTELDLLSLDADAEGGLFYADGFTLPELTLAAEPVPPTAAAAVPVDPFPAGLVFHSRPGSPNVLFLNFGGETVSGTAWNTSLSRTSIPAVAFSTDSDFTTFSDAEQTAIKRIWQRVAEDYAPFDLDVTTERPAVLDSRTGEALITRNTDADGASNPSSSAGGVAYLNVFGSSGYATHRPAWIYFNNVANNESYIAEAASHELGHNLGLSHDGKTDGTEYYSGHGSGEISWGPIMGTGYNRNVSQWSSGEYYLANNTQDDLATIAAKTAFRADDHGDTPATATALVLTGGTNIVSTTPETDPDNANPSNKGVIERETDVDVFSFVTGNGPVNLTVNPWIEPSGTTRGGNLDVLLELYDAQGTLVTTQNPTNRTVAQIQTTLPEGLYFLSVRPTGTGDPFSATPTGYTPYGSLGQYFISGFVTASSFAAAPLAELQAADLALPEAGPQPLTVTYADRLAIDLATLDDADLRVTGPNGYDRSAQFLGVSLSSNGTPCVATYAADPPSGPVWTESDNGTYVVWMQSNQVGNTQGATVAAGQLGQFNVSVPTCMYTADLDVDPGWTLQPRWEFGPPAYPGTGPAAGFTGANIVAYNLSGNYEDRLSLKYATTPRIDCSTYTNLTLQFRRWLRLRSGDTALVEVSTDGSSWSSVWSTSGTVADTAWELIQFPLPGLAAGSPSVQIRWGISSGASQNDIGWNLDDVRLFAGARLPQTSNAVLTVTVNEPVWGSVSPPGGTFADGTSVSVYAKPADYFRFVGWTGDLASTNNPLALTVRGNIALQAVFGEILTVAHGTPWWWLAAQGWTNDFENAETRLGMNAIPLWQSYLAGLDPADPTSQLRLRVNPGAGPGSVVLNWNAVTGRVYTLWCTTNLAGGFAPLSGAANLPSEIHTVTNTVFGPSPDAYYRLEVRKP